MFKPCDKEDIFKYLHYIDDRLNCEYCVQICGSAAVLLQNFDFRKTFDLDFVKPLNSVVSTVVQWIYKENPDINRRFFDDQASCVVCLLEDYEDRLVEIKDNFKYLKVFVISVVDWMVSKLEAPKFGDLLEHTHFITQERLDFIEENMHLYCGLRDDIAKNSLQILKNELKELNK